MLVIITHPGRLELKACKRYDLLLLAKTAPRRVLCSEPTKETLSFARLRKASGIPVVVQAASEIQNAPLPSADLTLSFPLINDNRVELRVLKKVSQEETAQIRTLFELWLEKIVER